MSEKDDMRWSDRDPLVWETEVEGVVPARQARSEATFVALVDAGRQLLESKTFDEMTISDVAKSAGASVSSFYARFKDKETYFAFIQERAMTEVEADLQSFLDGLSDRRVTDEELVRAISRFWVNIYRSNRGVYRASFKHASARPDIWAPFKLTGWRAATLLAEKLNVHLGATGRRLIEKDLRIALQFANGMLINAAINDPGPIAIEDPEMERSVAFLIASFLRLESAASFRDNVRSKGKRRKA